MIFIFISAAETSNAPNSDFIQYVVYMKKEKP